MKKKIISLLMVLVVLSTLCFNMVYGSEAVNIASRGETRISITQNSNNSDPNYVYSNYMALPSGNWAEFTVNFPEDGKYKVLAYACVVGKDVSMSVALSGTKIGTGTIKASKSWNDFATLSHDLGIYEFKKGVATIRLTSSGDSHLGGIAFASIAETASKSEKESEYKAAYLPTVINAENFDVGEDGSKSADGVNNGGAYRRDDGIDITEDSEDYTITLNPGEFVKYTFNVVIPDVYAIDIKASGNTNLEVYIDSMPYPVNIGIDTPSLGVIKGTDIYLEEGEHTIKLSGVENPITLDEIIFGVSDSENHIVVANLKTEQPKSSVQKSEEGNSFDYDSLDKKNEIYKTIYVAQNGSDEGDGSKGAPFKTFDRVLSELEAITPEMTGDIVISIASGYYSIEETIKMTELHGGKNGYNVILRGEDSYNKPILSGGIEVTGWEKATDYIWKAPINDDEIKHVRNLYVNDYPSIRARTKYTYAIDDYYVAEGSTNRRDGLYVEAANFPKVKRPENMEMVCQNVWALNRFIVEDIIYGEDGKNIMFMKNPAWSKFSGTNEHNPGIGTVFYLENSMEFLDEPGEFYFDDIERVIYYYPYKAEDMTKAKTYIGKTEGGLFEVSGESKENKISNVIIENLSFKYGAWNHASEEGIVCYQSDLIHNLEGGSVHMPDGADRCAPGQLKVNKAQNITIKDCDFICLGSSALDFEDAAQNIKVVGNLIRDISGAGMMIGTSNHNKLNGSMEQTNGETCKNFLVTNNVIRRIGNEYANQAAISIYYEADINITHNDISEVPYSGISAGWGWDSKTSLRSDEHKNIYMTYNKISDVLNVTDDGGFIYTLGEMPGSVIAYNHLFGSNSLKWGGIYHDAGSSYLDVHHNVVLDTPRWYIVSAGYGADYNKQHSNYSDTDNWWNTGKDLLNNKVEDATIVDPYNIPSAAQAIIDGAGLEPKYRYLLDDVSLPNWRKDRSKDRATEKFGTVGDVATYGWVEAEDFMPGKNGETYHKISETLKNNAYRTEGVSLTTTREFSGVGNGYVVQDVVKGEWMKYKFLAPEDGEYLIKLRYSHGSSTPLTFNLYIDNELVLDACGVEKGEKGWFNVVEADCGKVNLSAGEHIVKFEYIGGFYLDAVGLVNPNIPIPEKTIKQTSPDYDEGVLELETEHVIEYEFMDILGHWAQKDIMDMKDKGIINGISPTEFAPDRFLTREQGVWICMRAKGIYHTMENWEDVALSYGMISEKGKGTEIISREEFAHVVMKAYTSSNNKYKITIGNDYGDKDLIDQKYYNEILGARELGLMTGDENGNFRPKDGLTRAEAVTVAKRLLQ